MKQDPTLARRDLLRGAVALVGGSALGLSPVAALANAVVPSQAVSVGFWNGRRFVAAERLSGTDGELDRVLLTITSVGGGGFSALETHAPNSSLGPVPFTAWVAPPGGMDHFQTMVATAPDGSLLLAAYAKNGARHEVRLSSAALREGTYVLRPGASNWNAFGFDAKESLVQTSGLQPHIRIDVEPA